MILKIIFWLIKITIILGIGFGIGFITGNLGCQIGI